MKVEPLRANVAPLSLAVATFILEVAPLSLNVAPLSLEVAAFISNIAAFILNVAAFILNIAALMRKIAAFIFNVAPFCLKAEKMSKSARTLMANDELFIASHRDGKEVKTGDCTIRELFCLENTKKYMIRPVGARHRSDIGLGNSLWLPCPNNLGMFLT